MTAKEILEQLTEAYARHDLLNIDKKNAIPADVTKILNDIAAEFDPQLHAIGSQIDELEAQAKEAVLAEGVTVKGGALQAVYSKPRVTWDSKQLDGLMIIIPELSQARKVGAPSVSIRKIGG